MVEQGTSGPPLTVLIDGPSGSGKTWLSEYLRSTWPVGRNVVVVHMDDLYRGWNGLLAASDLVAFTLLPDRAQGKDIHWQRWDWAQGTLAEWNTVAHTSDLILEGCGTITQRSAANASMSIWINADEQSRKKWALSRGGDDFDQHWDDWDADFTRFREIHDPERHASLVVRSTR